MGKATLDEMFNVPFDVLIAGQKIKVKRPGLAKLYAGLAAIVRAQEIQAAMETADMLGLSGGDKTQYQIGRAHV